MTKIWQRMCGTIALLLLAGCASYYDDRYYYSDRYYDDDYYYADGYHPYSRWRSHGYHDPYHYDLYDPYLSLFLPFGWAYDPWYWRSHHFGVHLYPFRYFGFAFYGGRPWYHSPWYGGYGLYYPYFWRPNPQPEPGSTLTRDQVAGLPTARQATRGLAAGMVGTALPGAPAASAAALVRTTPVSATDGFVDRPAVLGSMTLPAQRLGQNGEGVRLQRLPVTPALEPESLGSVSETAPHADHQWRREDSIRLGRGQFPLQRVQPMAGSSLQPVADPTAAGAPRPMRWPMSAPATTHDGPSWQQSMPMRQQAFPQAESGPSWQGRRDTFRGREPTAFPATPSPRFEAPQRSFDAPRWDRGGGGDGGRGADHGRNQHEE